MLLAVNNKLSWRELKTCLVWAEGTGPSRRPFNADANRQALKMTLPPHVNRWGNGSKSAHDTNPLLGPVTTHSRRL